jgi:hypothetical protein
MIRGRGAPELFRLGKRKGKFCVGYERIDIQRHGTLGIVEKDVESKSSKSLFKVPDRMASLKVPLERFCLYPISPFLL